MAAPVIAGLYAAGEVACTGLHGANRLRVEFVARSGGVLGSWPPKSHSASRTRGSRRAWPARDNRGVTDADEMVVTLAGRIGTAVRRTMWNYVGIVRTTKRLMRAKTCLDLASRRDSRFLLELQGDERLARAAQYCRRCRSHRALRAATPREPRLALHARLSRASRERETRYDSERGVRCELRRTGRQRVFGLM